MKRFLLDTNVLSEILKPRPASEVLDFFARVPESALHVSILSLGEFRKGVVLRRRSDVTGSEYLLRWTEEMESRFNDRILPITRETAKLWGEWSAQRSRSVVVTLIAATAAVHDMVLVTRNIRDVQDLQVKILNPWKI